MTREKKKKELQINNSFFILEEFKPRLNRYTSPASNHVTQRGRCGKVKVFTRDEIENFKVERERRLIW